MPTAETMKAVRDCIERNIDEHAEDAYSAGVSRCTCDSCEANRRALRLLDAEGEKPTPMRVDLGWEPHPAPSVDAGWSEVEDATFAWFVGMYALLNLGTQREKVLSKMAPFETILYDTLFAEDKFQKRLADLAEPLPPPPSGDGRGM